MIRFASGYGSGRSRTALTMLKMAVFAPMPSASVIIATAANPGFLINCRMARRKLFITKRNHRIDTSRAAGWDKTGRGRDRSQQRCHRKINRRIEGVDFEQNVFQRRRSDYSEKQGNPAG